MDLAIKLSWKFPPIEQNFDDVNDPKKFFEKKVDSYKLSMKTKQQHSIMRLKNSMPKHALSTRPVQLKQKESTFLNTYYFCTEVDNSMADTPDPTTNPPRQHSRDGSNQFVRSSKLSRLSQGAWEAFKTLAEDRKYGSSFIFQRGRVLILLIIGTIVGIAAGIVLHGKDKKGELTERTLFCLRQPRDLFIAVLRILTTPIISSSIISAAGSMDYLLCRKVILLGVFLFYGASQMNSILALPFAFLIKPGKAEGLQHFVDFTPPQAYYEEPFVLEDVYLDFVRSMFPRNIVEASMKSIHTVYTTGDNQSLYNWRTLPITHEYFNNPNPLGLLTYSLAMGLAAAKLGVYGKPLIAFARCLSECVAYLANSLMWIVPLAIVFILISDIIDDPLGDITEIFLPYSPLIMCIIVGQLFWIATIVIIHKIVTKKSIRTFFHNLLPTLMVAFGTGQSELTIPVTLTCLDINGVNPRVSRFLVPVGAVICYSFDCMWSMTGAMFMLQYNDNFGVTIPAWKYFLASLVPPIHCVRDYASATSLSLLTVLYEQPKVSSGWEFNASPLIWLLNRFGAVTKVINLSIIVEIVSHLYQKQLEGLPDYNAILKEGLIFKRLSILKTSITSGDQPDKPSELKEKLQQVANEPVKDEEQARQRMTLARLMSIFDEPAMAELKNLERKHVRIQAKAKKRAQAGPTYKISKRKVGVNPLGSKDKLLSKSVDSERDGRNHVSTAS